MSGLGLLQGHWLRCVPQLHILRWISSSQCMHNSLREGNKEKGTHVEFMTGTRVSSVRTQTVNHCSAARIARGNREPSTQFKNRICYRGKEEGGFSAWLLAVSVMPGEEKGLTGIMVWKQKANQFEAELMGWQEIGPGEAGMMPVALWWQHRVRWWRQRRLLRVMVWWSPRVHATKDFVPKVAVLGGSVDPWRDGKALMSLRAWSLSPTNPWVFCKMTATRLGT